MAAADNYGLSGIGANIRFFRRCCVIAPHGFKATGSMATARASHTATLLQNGRVLVAGGTNTSGDTTTAEIYDPNTGSFSATRRVAEPPQRKFILPVAATSFRLAV